jgi:uncharacterized protein YjdB
MKGFSIVLMMAKKLLKLGSWPVFQSLFMVLSCLIWQSSTMLIVEGNIQIEPGVKYQTHVALIGWQEWVNNGAVAGTTGQSKQVEALRIKIYGLPGAKIEYRAHVKENGWLPWVSDGELSGTMGEKKRVEALQVRLVNNDNYGVMYQAHIQNVGWTRWYTDEEIAGTIGNKLRVEAIKIRLVKKG